MASLSSQRPSPMLALSCCSMITVPSASAAASRGRDVDPWRQIADWRRAISYLESRPEVDSRRIGLWGTSYAGGHALVLGATERRIACVVAQVPTISDTSKVFVALQPEAVPALEAALNDDERARRPGASRPAARRSLAWTPAHRRVSHQGRERLLPRLLPQYRRYPDRRGRHSDLRRCPGAGWACRHPCRR